MKEIIKEVIGEILENHVGTTNMYEALNKLENMKHIIEELGDNDISKSTPVSREEYHR
jgi:hypothetical protein